MAKIRVSDKIKGTLCIDPIPHLMEPGSELFIDDEYLKYGNVRTALSQKWISIVEENVKVDKVPILVKEGSKKDIDVIKKQLKKIDEPEEENEIVVDEEKEVIGSPNKMVVWDAENKKLVEKKEIVNTNSKEVLIEKPNGGAAIGIIPRTPVKDANEDEAEVNAVKAKPEIKVVMKKPRGRPAKKIQDAISSLKEI